MPKLNLPKTLSLSLGVLVMVFSLNYLILAWTEPSATAPNENVPAPINVGTSTQIKVGALGINGLFTAYSGISVNNQKITDLLTPTSDNDAVNKAYVDALSGGDVNVGMPLQGIVVLHDRSSTEGVSTVSIALPKSDCIVKFTVCDYNSAPPAKLIIGADPVLRTTKAVINLGPAAVNGTPSPTYGVGDCGGNCGLGTCQFMGLCGGFHDCCCPPSYSYFCSTQKTCISLSASYPNADCLHGYAYADPRCPSPDAGKVLGGYLSDEFLCAYCPTSHPNYDPSSKNCLSTSTVSTYKVGNRCSTLTISLKTSITDVTFANAAGTPVDVGSYVEAAYSCLP